MQRAPWRGPSSLVLTSANAPNGGEKIKEPAPLKAKPARVCLYGLYRQTDVKTFGEKPATLTTGVPCAGQVGAEATSSLSVPDGFKTRMQP